MKISSRNIQVIRTSPKIYGMSISPKATRLEKQSSQPLNILSITNSESDSEYIATTRNSHADKIHLLRHKNEAIWDRYEDEVYAIIRSTTAIAVWCKRKANTLSLVVFVTYKLVPNGYKNVLMKLLMALRTPREC